MPRRCGSRWHPSLHSCGIPPSPGCTARLRSWCPRRPPTCQENMGAGSAPPPSPSLCPPSPLSLHSHAAQHMDGLGDGAIAGQLHVGERLAQLHAWTFLKVHGLKEDQCRVGEVLRGEGAPPPKPLSLSGGRNCGPGALHTCSRGPAWPQGPQGGWEQLWAPRSLHGMSLGGSQAMPSCLTQTGKAPFWGIRMGPGGLALPAHARSISKQCHHPCPHRPYQP